MPLDPSDGAIPVVELSVYICYSEVHCLGKRGVSFEMFGYDIFGVNELVFREDGYLRVILGSLVVVGVSGKEVGG